MKNAWPPLIDDAVRPPWMLWRDRFLTVLVWLLFAILFIQQWLVFQERLRTYLTTADAEWDFTLKPFFTVIGVMLSWLGLSAIGTYRRAMRARNRPEPPPLALAREAAHFGVTPTELSAARQGQIIAVAIEAGGRFRFETQPTCTAVVVGTNRPAPPSPDRSVPGR
jgi:hypothetical protein